MPHRVVVVGAGFGGLQVVLDLKGAGCAITLIDQRNHHLFQPLLYQVATTLLATSDIAWPVRALMRDRTDVTTLLATVDGVDRDRREVLLRGGGRIGFDTLILATGARHAYFGHDEWEADAPGLKTLEDATTIRRRLLIAFEQAERAGIEAAAGATRATPSAAPRDAPAGIGAADGPVIPTQDAQPHPASHAADIPTHPEAERQALLTFAVIGAGPTGVELAGIIADLAHRTLPREFRHIDTRLTRILLVEAGPRILPAFSEKLSAYAARSLGKRGVEVLTGHPVTACSDRGIVLDGRLIPARTLIWAAGVQASRAKDWLGAEADRAGRVMVAPDLTLPGDPGIFVLGDTAHVLSDGKPVPGVAPAAKQQGSHVARTLRARLSGRPAPGPFCYRDMGNLATIGPNAAIIEYGRTRLTGWLAWWIWGIAHIYFLIGTRSRLFVAISWLWAFLLGRNSARLITQKETLKDTDTQADPAAPHGI